MACKLLRIGRSARKEDAMKQDSITLVVGFIALALFVVSCGTGQMKTGTPEEDLSSLDLENVDLGSAGDLVFDDISDKLLDDFCGPEPAGEPACEDCLRLADVDANMIASITPHDGIATHVLSAR